MAALLTRSVGLFACPARCARPARRACGLLLASAALAALAPVPSVAQQRSTGPELPLLTEIRAIRDLSQDGGALGYPVRLRGVVTHFDRIGRNSLIIHDGRFGQFVANPDDPSAVGHWDGLQAGDVVEIVGRTERGGFAPNVRPQRIRKIGEGRLPEPRTLPYSAMLTGRHDCDYVSIEGVVQRAWLSSDVTRTRVMFAEVATEEGSVRALFWDYEPADLRRLIDARVRLRGNVGTIFGRTEQLRGVSLFGGRARNVEILEPAPEPFLVPMRPARGLYNYSSAGEVNRRVRVRGVVTAVVRGHPVEIPDFTTTATFRYVLHVLYLRDETGGLRIETEQDPEVRPGDLVEASGFPGVTPAKPILKNAVFRIVGSAPEPTPVAISGGTVLTPDHDAEIVQLEAHVLDVLSQPPGRTVVLSTGDTVFSAILHVPPDDRGIARLRPGTLVSATGVYAYQPGPPPSFRLFARDAADIRVLAAAPWWTLQHTAVMALILAVAAILGTVAVRMQSRRKRREYQAVLSERTRVARELHDTLEQGLAGIGLQLEAVAGTLATSPERASRSLDLARQMLRYSLEEARRSVMDLRSQALESRDVAGALGDLARQMTAGTAAEAHVRVIGTPQRLDAAQEHHLLRIGLEALTNALKHAGASRIELELRFEAAAISLDVTDDGCGITHQDTTAERFGLRGIRERVDKLGGTFRIDSRPGGGTRLSVRIPGRGRPASPAGTPAEPALPAKLTTP